MGARLRLCEKIESNWHNSLLAFPEVNQQTQTSHSNHDSDYGDDEQGCWERLNSMQR